MKKVELVLTGLALCLSTVSTTVRASSISNWWATETPGAGMKQNGDANFAGSAKLRNQAFKSIKIAGSGDLEDIVVEGNIIATGRLEAKRCTFGSMRTTGKTELEKVTVNGDLDTAGFLGLDEGIVKGEIKVNGSLDIKNSVVQQVTLSFESGNIPFKKSKTKTITINCPDDLTKKVTVTLDGTTVNGDVVFNGSAGIVILKDGGKIEGTVINGSIEK
jgi:cytoskeletal protein CcmA (bactofilin family)